MAAPRPLAAAQPRDKQERVRSEFAPWGGCCPSRWAGHSPQPAASSCRLTLARRPAVSRLSQETSWNFEALGSQVTTFPWGWLRACAIREPPASPTAPGCPPVSQAPVLWLGDGRWSGPWSSSSVGLAEGWEPSQAPVPQGHWRQPQLPQAWGHPECPRHPSVCERLPPLC